MIYKTICGHCKLNFEKVKKKFGGGAKPNGFYFWSFIHVGFQTFFYETCCTVDFVPMHIKLTKQESFVSQLSAIKTNISNIFWMDKVIPKIPTVLNSAKQGDQKIQKLLRVKGLSSAGTCKKWWVWAKITSFPPLIKWTYSNLAIKYLFKIIIVLKNICIC